MDLNERVTSTFDLINRRTYHSAVEENIKDSYYINYNLLESETVQEQFAETMINNYYEEISSFKLNDPNQELFLTYGKILEEKLPQNIKDKGKDFTFDHFYYQFRPKLLDELFKLLQT